MCSSGSAPSPPPVGPAAPTPAPAPSLAAGTGVRQEAQRRRSATRGGTLLTGGRGLTEPANTAQKTLLGE